MQQALSAVTAWVAPASDSDCGVQQLVIDSTLCLDLIHMSNRLLLTVLHEDGVRLRYVCLCLVFLLLSVCECVTTLVPPLHPLRGPEGDVITFRVKRIMNCVLSSGIDTSNPPHDMITPVIRVEGRQLTQLVWTT
jgi:hypothetical protein